MKNNISTLSYWDSCVFLSYINSEPGRVDIVDALWDEVTGSSGKIITSTVAIVEVSHASNERKNGQLDPNTEDVIQSIWSDQGLALVELNENIAILAKDLIRFAITQGWILKPKDAIHLASAQWLDKNVMRVKEFITERHLESGCDTEKEFSPRLPAASDQHGPHARERDACALG